MELVGLCWGLVLILEMVTPFRELLLKKQTHNESNENILAKKSKTMKMGEMPDTKSTVR